MRQDTYQRAKERLERAWSEAKYLYSRRSSTEKDTLRQSSIKLQGTAFNLGYVFTELENTPCADCTRCCSQAAFSSGFHSHEERQALIAEAGTRPGYLPMDHIVENWGGATEPPERCLFLNETGCNLPIQLRSATCNTYVCMDKLAPALARQGLESKYKKARKEHSKKLRVIQDGLSDLDFETCVEDFGQG